jgi:hypothetical protein
MLLDRMRRALVEDVTNAQAPEGISPGDIAERSFTLFTPGQIQMPKLLEEAVKPEPKREEGVVDHAEAPARQPEQKILY